MKQLLRAWSPRIWLILIVALALGLRLSQINRESLWFDEAVSYLAATLPVSTIINNGIQSSHPPLYYLCLRLWQQFTPDGDGWLRLLGMMWNVLLIPTMAGLGRALFQKQRLGLAAALLTAVSPFQLLYSHELRMYTQLMLLATLGVWAYWQARQAPQRWRWFLLCGAAMTAAVYTHLFATLVLAGIGLHAFAYRQNRAAFWKTAVLVAVVMLLFMPWLVTLLAESQRDLGSLRPLTQDSDQLARNPAKPLTALAFLLFGISGNLIYSGVILFLTLAIAAILLLELRKLRGAPFPESVALLLILAGLIVGAPVGVYLVRPFFLPERTLAAAAPFLLLLLAWALTRRGTPLPVLAGLSGVAMLIGSLLYLSGPLLKPPYREAVAFVTMHAETDALIMHTSDGSYFPALRYAPDANQVLLAGDPDPRKPMAVYQLIGGELRTLAEILQTPQPIWLVVALEHSVEWQQAQVDQLLAVRGGTAVYKIDGIRVYKVAP